jgi:hypothetical protein
MVGIETSVSDIKILILTFCTYIVQGNELEMCSMRLCRLTLWPQWAICLFLGLLCEIHGVS